MEKTPLPAAHAHLTWCASMRATAPLIHFAVASALFAASLVPVVSLAAEDQVCDLAKSAISAASEIRQLQIKKPVPCFVQDKESVRSHILKLVNEKTPPARMHLEGQVYKAIGFIPEEFDYEKGLIDLYVGQLGGYYDPSAKYFVMAGWMPAFFQTTIAVHELTHALQDQYFDLEKFVDPKIENSDVLLARSALVEGDATAVMLDYSRKLAGLGSISSEPDVNSVLLQNVIGGAMTTSGSGIVPSLQLTLIFPYTSGLRFAHSLLLKGGFRTIDDSFRSPPRSTEEILHPEKYLEAERDFREYRDADVVNGRPGTVVYRDTLGEFVISALLGMFENDKNKVVEASVGWGGDRLVVLEKGEERTVLWRIGWDSERDADEFFAIYSAGLKRRYPEQFGSTVTISKEGKEVLVSIERKKL